MSNSIDRPFIVTFIGWSGIIVGVVKLISLFYQLPYQDWQSPVDLPAMPAEFGPLLAYKGVWTILGLGAAVGLLSGYRWARIYFTICYLLVLGGLATLALLLHKAYPAETPLLLALGCPLAGALIMILNLLYSTRCNQFFCPKKDPIPFNHYVTVWQLVIVLAFGLIGYGSFRIWEFWTKRVPLPVSATTVDPEAPNPLHTFTNKEGTTIRARLIYFDGSKVIIEREDGRRFNNDITLYSEADQAYIRKESGR